MVENEQRSFSLATGPNGFWVGQTTSEKGQNSENIFIPYDKCCKQEEFCDRITLEDFSCIKSEILTPLVAIIY